MSRRRGVGKLPRELLAQFSRLVRIPPWSDDPHSEFAFWE